MVLILAWFSFFLHMILRQGLGIFHFKYIKSILLLGYSFCTFPASKWWEANIRYTFGVHSGSAKIGIWAEVQRFAFAIFKK